MTGIFNFLGYNVSLYFLIQERYRMYVLIFLSLLGGMLSVELYTRFDKPALQALGCLLVFLTAMSGICTTGIYCWRRVNVSYDDDIAIFRETAFCAESYATGGDIFAGEQVVAAYFKTPSKILFDDYARPILAAVTEEEIEAAIDRLDAQIFVFNWKCDYYRYDALPFYQYLQESGSVTRLSFSSGGRWSEVYVVDERVWK